MNEEMKLDLKILLRSSSGEVVNSFGYRLRNDIPYHIWSAPLQHGADSSSQSNCGLVEYRPWLSRSTFWTRACGNPLLINEDLTQGVGAGGCTYQTSIKSKGPGVILLVSFATHPGATPEWTQEDPHLWNLIGNCLCRRDNQLRVHKTLDKLPTVCWRFRDALDALVSDHLIVILEQINQRTNNISRWVIVEFGCVVEIRKETTIG